MYAEVEEKILLNQVERYQNTLCFANSSLYFRDNFSHIHINPFAFIKNGNGQVLNITIEIAEIQIQNCINSIPSTK